MASHHVFEVSGRWSAEAGTGEIGLGGPQSAAISVPAAFGGSRPGTNPEELLLASALSCYGALRVEATIIGEVSRTPGGLHFDRIRLRPVIRGAGADPAEREAVARALAAAEEACFIARTLRAVIPYTLEPRFAD